VEIIIRSNYKQIILDMGSGNTCKNSVRYIMKMIDAVPYSTKYQIYLKWQLFKYAGDNIPLKPECFNFAYYYAQKRGLDTTASVFDRESLDLLLSYRIPFVKIANNAKLEPLGFYVPKKVPIYLSRDGSRDVTIGFTKEIMACISKYPARVEDYIERFAPSDLRNAISDHTEGLELFKRYQPHVWEKHYKLEDSTGLDAGTFAITPEQLKEIL
jgi:sialic acid synthase SpsE